MRFVIGIVALALVAFAQPSVATEPASMASLQPFRTFAKGEGEGVAYSYVRRSKADFVALLRDKEAKKHMRLSCETLVRQMAEGHGLPFEGCEGAAAAIEKDPEYIAVPCRDEMFQKDGSLVVTNAWGTAFGLWHRQCLPREHVLLYKGRPVISLTCLNVILPVRAPTNRIAAGTVTAPGTCANGYRLVAHAWSPDKLSPAIREEAKGLMAAAAKRDARNATNPEAYKPDAVSRTLGGRLRQEPWARAQVDASVRVVLRDPHTAKVVREIGVLRLSNGVGSIDVGDERSFIIETIWPDSFMSPSISGGAPRLWLFPYEWKEWCTMNVHGITS